MSSFQSIPHARYFAASPFFLRGLRMCGTVERPLFCAVDLFRALQLANAENTLAKLIDPSLWEKIEFHESDREPTQLSFVMMAGAKQCANFCRETNDRAVIEWLESEALPALTSLISQPTAPTSSESQLSESPDLAALIVDAAIALETLTNSPTPAYQLSSAEWLEQIARQAAELIRNGNR